MIPGGPYRITTSRAFDEHLDEFLGLAKRIGVYDRVLQALPEIVGHLEFHPLLWGDPVQRLEAV